MMRTDCGMLAWPAVVLVLCVTLRDGFAADRAGKRMVPFRGLRLGADDGLGRRSVVCSGVVSSLPSVCPFGTLRASSYGHTTNGFSPHVRLFVPGTFNSLVDTRVTYCSRWQPQDAAQRSLGDGRTGKPPIRPCPLRPDRLQLHPKSETIA